MRTSFDVDVVIRVDGLSKRYRLGTAVRHHDTLRDHLTETLKSAFLRRGRGPSSHHSPDTIWALSDVSFDVKKGEVVGIIGRNGAGKSTLLKILSRITAPTKGQAEIRGRVGSLLEVGTGFHPELTGRENIYLNAAILGMKKAEIESKFDQIIAFAEIEKFIDTPLKRYSSGMHVRLAFAVAAHLEPEILIVDEVLAVGDLEFQKKCLGKMQDVTRQGRTILFVSHNMGAIKSLCTRAMLLDAGRLAFAGSVDGAVDAYCALMASSDTSQMGLIPDTPRLWSTPEAKLRFVQLTTLTGRTASQLYFGQPFRVCLTFDVLSDISEAVLEVGIATMDGTRVTFSSNIDGEQPPATFPRGRHSTAVDIDITLLPRQYTIDLGIHHRNGTTIDWVEHALDFTVLNVAEAGADHYPWTPHVRGYVRPSARWHVHEPPAPAPSGTMPAPAVHGS